MTHYDWIKSPEFKYRVQRRIEKRLTEAALQGEAPALADQIMRIAGENVPALRIRSEPRKQQKKIALKSVDTIMFTSIDLARKEQRRIVGEKEIRDAIE